MPTRDQAARRLAELTGGQARDFRDGQWDAIESLIRGPRRLLLVRATGWGKSLVYFLATRFLRDGGAGPTLVVSPLLSLMRNQIAAARAIGLVAATVNSDNGWEWPAIKDGLDADRIDLLLVSPERLANDDFRANWLAPVAERIALLVVDEAHCISDWGHDFRPDYQRIAGLMPRLSADASVLAATATANARVVDDLCRQLGPGLEVDRGPLARPSLILQVVRQPDPAARLAWLADAVPRLPGSGIVYTLTRRDAERVAGWLQTRGIAAESYHGGWKGSDDVVASARRQGLERDLLDDRLKVLVATLALGMGFDKPDLGFVLHYQAPPSVVHYYQQIGRAGRDLDSAYAVLLAGREDQRIARAFAADAMAPDGEALALLEALAAGPLTLAALAIRAGLPAADAEKTLKLLALAQPPAVVQDGAWRLTGQRWRPDPAARARLGALRRAEAGQMAAYVKTGACLMRFLTRALDDPHAESCGRCANCRRTAILDPRPARATLAAAARVRY